MEAHSDLRAWLVGLGDPIPSAALMRFVRTIAGAAMLTALLTCGGDGGQGPPPGPEPVDVEGHWSISTTFQYGPDQGCVEGPQLYDIAQSGSHFSGTGAGTWTMTCWNGVDTVKLTYLTPDIYRGRVNGDSIKFDYTPTKYISAPKWDLVGTVSGDSMSGTYTREGDAGRFVGHRYQAGRMSVEQGDTGFR